MKKIQRKSWIQNVMKTSFALDLEPGVFTFVNPRLIARSLKKSAECSTQRKAGPFQSAMSMLNYYINRAGTRLPAKRKETLEQAKDELRKLYSRKKRQQLQRKNFSKLKSSQSNAVLIIIFVLSMSSWMLFS